MLLLVLAEIDDFEVHTSLIEHEEQEFGRCWTDAGV